MVRSLFAGIVIGFLLASVFWLGGWHVGFDVGYGAAMSDALLNIKSPEQFFKDKVRKK